MPGRHGKQRVKKNRSKRAPLQPMEKLVKQSWIGRQNKETSILNELMPVEKVEVKKANHGFNVNNTTISAMKSVKAAPATKNISDSNIRSVATTKKNLSEENWMTKDRYAKKAQEKSEGNGNKEALTGKKNKKNLVAKPLTPKQKEYQKNKKIETSIKATRNAAQDLLNSIALK